MTARLPHHPPAAPPDAPRAMWWRIGMLLVLVLALVLILISFLNYSNYRKTYLELNLTRYLVLAKDVRQTIETGLNVGLPPLENARLLPAIQELARRHGGIRYIAILDDSGAVLGAQRVPAATLAQWRARLQATAATDYWQAQDAATYQLGMPFLNNFNLKAGAIIVAYDKGPITAATDAMLRALGTDVLLVLLVLAALTLAGSYALTRTISAELVTVGQGIDAALGEAAPCAVDEHILGGGVADDINAFAHLSHEVAGQLAALEQLLAQPPASHPERSA